MSNKIIKNNTKKQNNSDIEITNQQYHEFYQGPLPPPNILEAYEKLYPESVKIIFSCFERQVNHRIDLENKVIKSDIKARTTGMILGFILGIISLCGALLLIYLDKKVEGFVLILIETGVLVGSFMYSKKEKIKELKDKSQLEKRGD